MLYARRRSFQYLACIWHEMPTSYSLFTSGRSYVKIFPSLVCQSPHRRCALSEVVKRYRLRGCVPHTAINLLPRLSDQHDMRVNFNRPLSTPPFTRVSCIVVHVILMSRQRVCMNKAQTRFWRRKARMRRREKESEEARQ